MKAIILNSAEFRKYFATYSFGMKTHTDTFDISGTFLRIRMCLHMKIELWNPLSYP